MLFYFKTKNLKPYKGFKLNAYKVLRFSKNWEKVAQRWYNRKLIWISPWWSNLDMYTLHIWNSINPHKWSKISVSYFGVAIPRFRRIEMSPILGKALKLNTAFTETVWINRIVSFIMNRNQSIQSGCSIINLAQNGAELSKDISKGSIISNNEH